MAVVFGCLCVPAFLPEGALSILARHRERRHRVLHERHSVVVVSRPVQLSLRGRAGWQAKLYLHYLSNGFGVGSFCAPSCVLACMRMPNFGSAFQAAPDVCAVVLRDVLSVCCLAASFSRVQLSLFSRFSRTGTAKQHGTIVCAGIRELGLFLQQFAAMCCNKATSGRDTRWSY